MKLCSLIDYSIKFCMIILPGEDLDGGILNSYILEADEALVLSAIDHFDDDSIKSEYALQTPVIGIRLSHLYSAVRSTVNTILTIQTAYAVLTCIMLIYITLYLLLFLSFKNGASFCSCAYVLRISGHSDFFR